jgi:hypothetical protein
MLGSSEDCQQIHQEQPKTTNQNAKHDSLLYNAMGKHSHPGKKSKCEKQ